MAKFQKYGSCAFCNEVDVKLTREHVVPRSWYPPSAADSATRIIAPACSACQALHEKVESAIFQPLAATADSELDNGLWEMATKGIRQREGLDDRERHIRRRRAEDMLAKIEISTTSSSDPRASRPYQWHLDESRGLYAYGSHTMTISFQQINAIIVKFTKGIFWFATGEEIPGENTIEGNIISHDRWPIALEVARKTAENRIDSVPTYHVFYSTESGTGIVFWTMLLWGYHLFQGYSLTPEMVQRREARRSNIA